LKLPKDELLNNSQCHQELERLICQAERVFHTWQPSWSDFVSAKAKEELYTRFSKLNYVNWFADGGFEGAERQRLYCSRTETEICLDNQISPLSGLVIEGNFLFDNANPQDFRNAIIQKGINSHDIGDIWTIGDRGAEAFCTPQASQTLHKVSSQIRETAIEFISVKKEELHLPIRKQSRHIKCFEASTRVDAISSAGFGISRSKTARLIKEGYLRLNWDVIKQPSRELRIGDKINLESKGTIVVVSIEKTKRDRWLIELIRN